MSTGPRQPLEERDAEIERLRNLLFHLANYVRVNVLPGYNDPALEAFVAESIRAAKPVPVEKPEMDWSQQVWWNGPT